MKNVIPIVMAGGKINKINLDDIPYPAFYLALTHSNLSILLSRHIPVIGIYGLIVGVILAQSIVKPSTERENSYSTFTGLAHLCAGLCTGVSGLAAGICIGVVGDYGIRAVGYRASAITLFPTSSEKEGYSSVPDSDADGHEMGGGEISGSEDQNKLFVGMLIMLIFSEALALYGMIVALIVSQHSYSCETS
jgi:F0F1-type ATP synthase membrane subunit c/vacuolar-type H+-ATPase subunit K